MNEGNNEKEDENRKKDGLTERSMESIREEMDAICERHANLMRAMKEKAGAIPDVKPIIIPDARQRTEGPFEVITLSDSSSNSSRDNSPGPSTAISGTQNPPVASNAQPEVNQQASSSQNNPAECTNKRVKAEEVPVTDDSIEQQAQIASDSNEVTDKSRQIKKEQLPVNGNLIEQEHQPSIDMPEADQIVNDIINNSEPAELPADNNESQPIKPVIRQNCRDCKLPKEIYAKNRCRVCCFKLAKRLERQKKEKPLLPTKSSAEQETVKTTKLIKPSTSFSADQQEMPVQRCLVCKFEITTETQCSEDAEYCKACHRVRGNSFRNCIICNTHARVVGHGSCTSCYYLYRSGIQQQPFHKQGRIVFRKINNHSAPSTSQAQIKQQLASPPISTHDENSPQSLLRKVSDLFNGNCDANQTSPATPKTPVNQIPEGVHPTFFKPKGWRKGQCKLCSSVLTSKNVTVNPRDCKNYCDYCYMHKVNQRVCIRCNQTKRHLGKGMCRECYEQERKPGQVTEQLRNNHKSQSPRKTAAKQREEKKSPEGQCDDCGTEIDHGLRCTRCDRRYRELQQRNDPKNIRYCAKCKRIRWHRGLNAKTCYACYHFEKQKARELAKFGHVLKSTRRRGRVNEIEKAPNGNIICKQCRIEYQFINNQRTSMTLCGQCFKQNNLTECLTCKKLVRHYARGRCRVCYSVFIKTCKKSGRSIKMRHDGVNRSQHLAAPSKSGLSLKNSAGPSTSKTQAAGRFTCKDCKIQVANHTQFNFRTHRCLSCFSKFMNKKHRECVDCNKTMYIQAAGRCSSCYKKHRFGDSSLAEGSMPELAKESENCYDRNEETCVQKEIKEEQHSPVKTAQSNLLSEFGVLSPNHMQNSAQRSTSSRQATPAMSASSEKLKKCQFCAIRITGDKVCVKTPLICNECFQIHKQKLRICVNCEELCKHYAHGMCDSCYHIKIRKPKTDEKKHASPQPSNSTHERSVEIPSDPFHHSKNSSSGMIVCEGCNENKLRYAVGLCSTCYMKRFKGILSSNSTDPILGEEKPESIKQASIPSPDQQTGICVDCSQIKSLVGGKRCRPCFNISKAYSSPSKAKKIKTEEQPSTSNKSNGPPYRSQEDDDVIVLD